MSSMSPSNHEPGGSELGSYEVRVEGHLAARLAAWFDGVSLTDERDGTTVIHGPHSTSRPARSAPEGPRPRSAADLGDPGRIHPARRTHARPWLGT
jgi:hypothetical protein